MNKLKAGAIAAIRHLLGISLLVNIAILIWAGFSLHERLPYSQLAMIPTLVLYLIWKVNK